MCLAIPGKVLEIDPSAEPRMGNVDFSGIRKRICLDWVPDVNVGDYVIVHVGFAISKVDEVEAQETIAMLKEMGESRDELNTPGEGS